MNYIIKSKRQVEDTLFTVVEYDFNGTKVEVEVAHFQPQSADDITLGITNRGASEERKLQATQKVFELLGEI